MPTPAEQKALIFLGAVALVGGAVRLFGNDGAPAVPTTAEQAALSAQIAATESAAAVARAEREARKSRSGGAQRRKSRGAADRRGPTADAPFAADPFAAHARRPTADAPFSQLQTPLDIDKATAAELDALPGIGPALAARIVADRAVNGPFGSMEALDAVSGVGPTLIKRLNGHVTFSGPRRPSTANGSGGGKRLSGRVVGLIGGRP